MVHYVELVSSLVHQKIEYNFIDVYTTSDMYTLCNVSHLANMWYINLLLYNN